MIHRISQSTNNTVPEELQTLRSAIVTFHQNMKILYNRLRNVSSQGTIQLALWSIYKPYLENIAAAPVFPATFTTDQLRQHLRYLEGILKKLLINPMTQDTIKTKYQGQTYYGNLFLFGNKIKEIITPAATGIKSTLSDQDLLTQAAQMSNLLGKVGSNLVKRFNSYLEGLTENNPLGRVLAETTLEKLITKIDRFYLASKF